MKSLLFFYTDETKNIDKVIDKILVLFTLSFLLIVFFDWSYWKSAPYPLHTFLIYAIVFTLLFFRFCHGLDLKRVIREPAYPPRLICALFSGLNSIALNVIFLKSKSKYPEFLK